MFDPKTDKYPYPEQTDKHYLKIKKNNSAQCILIVKIIRVLGAD